MLWRREGDQVRVAVVHRPRYDDWSLPKGKLDDNEPSVLAAVREVQEETGFASVVGRTLGESRYRVMQGTRDVPKTVRWWALCAAGGTFTATAEVDELLWLDVPSALRRVTAGRDSGPLKAFLQHPPETTTVLLVRHGSAGRAQEWNGPDERRPLDPKGLRQAQATAAVLPVYGPRRVLSAPPLRCRQTVQPLADRLGVQVEVDPDLAEQSYAALPGRLQSLGEEGAPVVACSQGGAIPYALTILTEGTGLAAGGTDARKGSLWALSFSGRRLVDADYTASLATS